MASSEQRGFSLVEITVAVAIIAVVAASSVAFALASRPTALWAATTQFDSMLSSARSIGAAYGDGATIFVSSSPGPSNFRADLYAHRPSATASTTPMPSQVQPIIAQVAISESQILGPPPFAVIIHGNGDIGVRKNYTRGDPVTDAELPCPASNQLVFVFTVNGQTATRTLPCHNALAYTGTTTQKPPGNPGATPTPWSMPSCDPTDNGCPLSPVAPVSPPPCPEGTISYNDVCRAPLRLTIQGPTALNGECEWVNNITPCAFTVSEDFYPAPHLITATSSNGEPCPLNFSINSAFGAGQLTIPNAYTGTSPTTWSITPQSLIASSCVLLLYDDRGPGDANGSQSLTLSVSPAIGCTPNCSSSPSAAPSSPPPGCTPTTTTPACRASDGFMWTAGIYCNDQQPDQGGGENYCANGARAQFFFVLIPPGSNWSNSSADAYAFLDAALYPQADSDAMIGEWYTTQQVLQDFFFDPSNPTAPYVDPGGAPTDILNDLINGITPSFGGSQINITYATVSVSPTDFSYVGSGANANYFNSSDTPTQTGNFFYGACIGYPQAGSICIDPYRQAF